MAQNSPPSFDPRALKLRKHLDGVLHGTTPPAKQNHKLFLEAICIQPNPVTCINKILSTDTGIVRVQSAMFSDSSTAFFNGLAATFLNYLRSPDLANISGGRFLDGILHAVVDPDIFWSKFVHAFRAGDLQEKGQEAFAWLLLQLISLVGEKAEPYLQIAGDSEIIGALHRSFRPEIQSIATKIQNILDTRNAASTAGVDYVPGGRHDNDFEDFRKIAIVPTAEEITSTVRPFLRSCAVLDDPQTRDSRLATYLDNQFRLLREDMVYELREELQITLGKKRSKRKGLVIDGLELIGLHCGPEKKRCKWGMEFLCNQDIPRLKGLKERERKKLLQENRKILAHRSLSCLLFDGEPVAFPTINRDEDLLCKNPPIIILHFNGRASTTKVLHKLKATKDIKLIQIDTALFSYEPVLKALQETTSMPLSEELLFWEEDNLLKSPPVQPDSIVQPLMANPYTDLQTVMALPKKIILDRSQATSLLSGLTQRVSLIQGPPGTGKSFIGALLAKILHDHTEHIVLVVCYTNHALDQFLEELLDIGIPEINMVRLGGKSTARTAPLSLRAQERIGKWSKVDWKEIDDAKCMSANYLNALRLAFQMYQSINVRNQDLLLHLEFEDSAFFEAFEMPKSEDGMVLVGRKGQAVESDYLLNQWIRGWDAGIYKDHPHIQQSAKVWEMGASERHACVERWKADILNEQVEDLCNQAQEYNETIDRIERKYAENKCAILRNKRIIGCTTTSAAMHAAELQGVCPGVLLVEEAGEILESHVLTALGSHTEQLILIGDHKQLRPKVNKYELTVEKGDGYDLNRSLFERLVLKGYPHQTLTKQHRMRPEISALIRALTYPDLLDAEKTQGRPDLRGVQDVVVFINHHFPEDSFADIADKRDLGSTNSKQNTYEAEMILRIVRYLAQQGYGTKDMVILTPYLGQLSKLREMLKKDNDPILNDLDSHDLLQAGLLLPASAGIKKNPIRLATIDNYQGEESDVVLISLTRSNSSHDIGFMFAPERLNVLLSRARNALVMIGNADTFMKSRKGRDLWTQMFEMLKDGGHIYGGFPIKCQKHPDRMTSLSQPADFDLKCPDGGCTEPCGTMLSCGLHTCPSKCHQLVDHSKMPCKAIIQAKCPKGHDLSHECRNALMATCDKCDRETKLQEAKRRAALELQRKQDEEQFEYDQRLAELESRIATEQQTLRNAQITEERQRVISQKERDLQDAADRAAQASANPVVSGTAHPSSPSTPSILNIVDNLRRISPLNIFGLSTTTSPTPAPDKDSEARGSAQTPSESPAKQSNSTSTSTNDPTSTTKPVKQNDRFPPLPPSNSKMEWQRQKDFEGARDNAIDAIMEMIGLETVKAKVLAIKDKIDITKRQGTSLKDERFNIVMLGNPGTGKTTVARLYAQFLASAGVLPGNRIVETTGSRLAHDGVAGSKKHIEEILNAGGGAMFVDEAYQLASEHNSQGSQVLDFLLAEMENNVGKIVFILAGYNKEMEKFFEHNPGLTSRVPHTLQFEDYTRSEFLSMLEQSILKKHHGRMKVEDGMRGLYARIAMDRLSRGRGRNGFGNARDLQNMLSRIYERQAERIKMERRDGLGPDDFLLCREDLIGPDPSKVLVKSTAWKKLQGLTGLGSVKTSIRNLFDQIEMNYQRELLEMEPVHTSLNRVFHGSPGTGKTTVAKLYGQILAEMRLLSKGEVVVKNPADFIGAHLGQSEQSTKAILATTAGKVLIIDEAYMLYGGGKGDGGNQDTYKTAVIDTIVAEVQSVPGEDRCVLLLGYKDQMVEMFQNVNPGLARRFDIENAFHFEDFTDSELLEILNLKLKDQDLDATDAAKAVAIDVLSRARHRPNFGNGGDVENLLSRAKSRYQTRRASLPIQQRSSVIMFEPQDFDPDFDRVTRASSNLKKLFEDVVGCDEVVSKLDEYQQLASAMKLRGEDSRELIPTNFVLKGPPGTGKTTIARKMGQVYYDMGFLSSTEVVECSASDLIGQYVGHTGPKAKKLFEKALGRVLFIDEAYRLGEGRFAQEAVDEMVGMLTQEKFKGKIVVILAGYDQDMNKLMAVNSGLSSRFPEEIVLKNFPAEKCLEVLKRELKKKNVEVAELDNPASPEHQTMVHIIENLSTLPSWGNARDMLTLSKEMIGKAIRNSKDSPANAPLSFPAKDAIACMHAMLTNKYERSTNVPTVSSRNFQDLPQMTQSPPAPPPPTVSITQSTAPATHQKPATKNEKPDPKSGSTQSTAPATRQKPATKNERPDPRSDTPTRPTAANHQNRHSQVARDPGVSDQDWQQLQEDKRAAQRAADQSATQIQNLARDEKRAQDRERARVLEAQKLQQARARDAAEQAELKRKQDEARRQFLAAQRERARIAAELKRRREAEEERRRQEAQVQTKLRRMGVCVAGFQWIKQESGYRCAGGSHFISNDRLGL